MFGWLVVWLVGWTVFGWLVDCLVGLCLCVWLLGWWLDCCAAVVSLLELLPVAVEVIVTVVAAVAFHYHCFC